MLKGVLQEIKVLLDLSSFLHGITFSLFCCLPQLCIDYLLFALSGTSIAHSVRGM